MRVIYGSEVYCVDKYREQLVVDKEVMVIDELTSEARMFLDEISFFAEKEKCVVFLPGAVKDIVSISDEWINEPNLYIFWNGKDNELVSFVKKKGIASSCFDKYSYSQLTKFVKNRLPDIPDDVLSVLLKLLNYEAEERSLYSVVLDIEKVKCLPFVSIESIRQLFGEQDVEANAFEIGKLLINGRCSEALKIANNCPAEQELLFVGALQRFYRVGWKKNYFASKEVGYGEKVDAHDAKEALVFLERAKESIVSGQNPKVALMKAIQEIAIKRGTEL